MHVRRHRPTVGSSAGYGRRSPSPPEFRNKVLELLKAGHTVAQVALILQSAPISPTGVLGHTQGAVFDDTTRFPFMVNGVNSDVAVPTLDVHVDRIRLHVLNASLVSGVIISRVDGKP